MAIIGIILMILSYFKIEILAGRTPRSTVGSKGLIHGIKIFQIIYYVLSNITYSKLISTKVYLHKQLKTIINGKFTMIILPTIIHKDLLNFQNNFLLHFFYHL